MTVLTSLCCDLIKVVLAPLPWSELKIIYLSSDWSRLIDDARPRLVRQLTSSSSRWVRNVREERSVIRGEIRPSLLMRSRTAQSNLLPLEFPYQSPAPTRLLQIERISANIYQEEAERRERRCEDDELSWEVSQAGTNPLVLCCPASPR